MRLRRTQICPIHHSRFCCRRETVPKERRPYQIGARRIDDPHHLRGYRELRSNAEMRKPMNRKIDLQSALLRAHCSAPRAPVQRLRYIQFS